MNTPRINPVAEPLSESLSGQMGKLIPRGMPAPKLFLSVARNENLFTYMVESGLIGPTGLLDRRSLPKDLRETIILRTCVATRNDYEFNLHVQTISARMGLTISQIDDIRHVSMKTGLWRAEQLVAAALVDELIQTLAVSDVTYTQARVHFTEEQLIDITQLVGLYTGVAMMVGLIRPEFDRYADKAITKATV